MASYKVENIESVDELLDNKTNEDVGVEPMIFAPDEPRVTVTERVLNIPDELQTIGVENDNNVERIYFEIPRYFDEVNDLSEFNFYINYLNANQEPNQYHCTDLEVEGDNVVFSWLTSENVYAYRGIVRFIVYAVASDNRKWNTTVAELNVLEGLETEGQIIDNNPDIINELINLQEQFEEALDTIEQQQSTIEAQQSTISSQQTTITNQQNKITEQQDQIDNAIEVMGDYEIVQDNPTQIRFKKGDGTYGDTVNLGDNLASKSMVNAGYDTYSGNSYSGSASDYGIEIGKASGAYEQVTTNGYQLFDASKIATKSKGGATVTYNGDGSFTVSGNGQLTNAWVTFYDLSYESFLKLCKDPTKVSLNNNGVSNPSFTLVVQKVSDGTVVASVSNGKTVDVSSFLSDDYRFRFQFYGANGSTIVVGITKPMLYCQGDGTWEPFTGGEPSPNPNYAQEPKFFEPTEFVSHSKNLLDNDNIANYFDKNYGTYNGYKIKNLKPNTKYIMSTNVPKSEPATLYFGGIITSINGVYVNIPKTMSTNKNGEIDFYIRTDNSSGYNLDDFVNGKYYIQLEEGENATPYNDYKGQSTTPLDIILRALPNGVCDTYEDGIVTRRIGKVVFDGSDDGYRVNNYTSPSSSTNNFGYYIITINGIVNVGSSSNIKSFLVNKLQKVINPPAAEEMSCYQVSTSIIVFTNQYITKEEFNSFLQSNPIEVWYELEIPTTEYYSFPIIPSYFPYTNAWHDSEVEASDLTWFINTYARNSEYTDEFLQKFFALQRTGKVYTVRFPLWNTSQSPVGEKLHHNVGLTCTPSTDTVVGQDDYESIPLFKTYDVNAYVDDTGKIHVTAFKGDENFRDVGKVDVFVLGMSYYERYWEGNGYWYYSRTDSPKDGYKIARECVGNDGRIMPYALYSKYVSGEIDGTLYSSKGLKPRRNMSYNVSESEYHKRGKYYGGGKTSLYKYLLTTFYLKYATLNTQSVMQGTSNYSYQYACVQAENNVKRVVLTTAQANNFVVGSYVSIGEKGGNSSVDRGNSYMHNIADSVKILSIESVGDSNSAINVDVEEPFDTTTTTYISTMHWCSGFSDDVLGRDGSPSSLTDAKHPMVLQGIETMVGGYEVMGNAIMDITSSTGTRKPYIINDNSKIIQSVTNIKSTYETSNDIQPTTLNAWNYITEMKLDIENGYFGITKAGVSGSGSTVGFCDGLYVDNSTSGQRELLALGALGSGVHDGLSCLHAHSSLSNARWAILSRLSI